MKTGFAPFAIVLCASSMALAAISTADYELAQETIARDYRLGNARCEPMAADAKAICVATARSDERAALAKLGAEYNVPGTSLAEARKYAAAAKRDADFAVDKEKCEAYAGSVKQACVADAKVRFGKS